MMPVHVLASIVPIAVNVSLRMHVCIGDMPALNGLRSKCICMHARMLLQEVLEQLVTCAQHLH